MVNSNNTKAELQEKLISLCLLYIQRIDFPSFSSVLDKLKDIAFDRLEVRALTILSMLWQDDISSVTMAPSDIWAGLRESLLMRICRICYLIKAQNVNEALRLIEDEIRPPLEIYLLKAKVLSKIKITSRIKSANKIYFKNTSTFKIKNNEKNNNYSFYYGFQN